MGCHRRELRRPSQHATERRVLEVYGRGGANQRSLVFESGLIASFHRSIHRCIPERPEQRNVSAQEGRSDG
jgi:hypothetical protein